MFKPERRWHFCLNDGNGYQNRWYFYLTTYPTVKIVIVYFFHQDRWWRRWTQTVVYPINLFLTRSRSLKSRAFVAQNVNIRSNSNAAELCELHNWNDLNEIHRMGVFIVGSHLRAEARETDQRETKSPSPSRPHSDRCHTSPEMIPGLWKPSAVRRWCALDVWVDLVCGCIEAVCKSPGHTTWTEAWMAFQSLHRGEVGVSELKPLSLAGVWRETTTEAGLPMISSNVVCNNSQNFFLSFLIGQWKSISLWPSCK